MEMMEEGIFIYDYLRANLLLQWTWGFNSPKFINRGIQFNVDGLAFKGTVRIRMKENGGLIVNLLNGKGGFERRAMDVDLMDLKVVLDNHIDGVHGDWWQAFKKRYVQCT